MPASSRRSTSRPRRAAALLLFAPLAAPVPQEAAPDAFPNAELLVTTAWLAEHGADAGCVVLDTRSEADYARAHVPGALSLPTSATFLPGSRGDIASPSQLAALLGALGITRETHVVLYDEGRSTSAPRVFWTLESYGHEHVSVVDGGLPRWYADGRAVTDERPPVTATEYEVGPLLARCSTADAILADLEDPTCAVLDSRSAREFDGGRIPGAVHVDWLRNFTPGSKEEPAELLPPAELRALYADVGITRDKRVHAY